MARCTKKVIRYGNNSLAIVIPYELAEAQEIGLGDLVECEIKIVKKNLVEDNEEN